MSMERSRRERFSNVAPTPGEFLAATIVAGLFFVVTTPLVVQGVVSWVTSGNFAWPDRHLVDAYAGLLHGHFGAGLPPPEPGDLVTLPADAVMWVLTLVGEVLVLGAVVVVGLWMRDLSGTSSRHGLATATQAGDALGLPRLRKSAALIRPDLAERPQRRRRPGLQGAGRSGLSGGRDPVGGE